MLAVIARMRFSLLILSVWLVAGCSKDDARLQGTWRSNREATVAAAFERDPRWTNATPEKVERFRDMFGQMTLTYAKGVVTSSYRSEVGSFRYRVVERGTNFVVIRTDGGLDEGRNIKMRFVDGDKAYWIDSGPLSEGLQERFDRVTTVKGVQK